MKPGIRTVFQPLRVSRQHLYETIQTKSMTRNMSSQQRKVSSTRQQTTAHSKKNSTATTDTANLNYPLSQTQEKLGKTYLAKIQKQYISKNQQNNNQTSNNNSQHQQQQQQQQRQGQEQTQSKVKINPELLVPVLKQMNLQPTGPKQATKKKKNQVNEQKAKGKSRNDDKFVEHNVSILSAEILNQISGKENIQRSKQKQTKSQQSKKKPQLLSSVTKKRIKEIGYYIVDLNNSAEKSQSSALNRSLNRSGDFPLFRPSSTTKNPLSQSKNSRLYQTSQSANKSRKPWRRTSRADTLPQSSEFMQHLLTQVKSAIHKRGPQSISFTQTSQQNYILASNEPINIQVNNTSNTCKHQHLKSKQSFNPSLLLTQKSQSRLDQLKQEMKQTLQEYRRSKERLRSTSASSIIDKAELRKVSAFAQSVVTFSDRIEKLIKQRKKEQSDSILKRGQGNDQKENTENSECIIGLPKAIENKETEVKQKIKSPVKKQIQEQNKKQVLGSKDANKAQAMPGYVKRTVIDVSSDSENE